ncbi:MAG: hypothetical protein K0S37_544 [Microbacterium sp.]|jgi:AraC-like DNA-binding protein|nr:hypothetical protein [Microbacterium sp.]
MLATMQASQALERAGWMPHTSRAGILEVVSAAEEGFAISRILQDRGTFHRALGDVPDDRAPGVVVMFQLDGRAVVETRDVGAVTLNPGQVLITPDDANLTYTARTPARRVEVAFGLLSPELTERSIQGSLDSTVYARLMIAAVNEVLDNLQAIAAPGLLRLRLGLWEFVSAIRDVLAPRPAETAPHARRIHDEAVRRVARGGSDERLTVRDLCESLHVSERHLRAVLSDHGDSPSGMIRRARVYRAALALRNDPPLLPERIDELARSLGYSGRRQMRREFRALVASSHEADLSVRVVALSLPAETRTLIGV